MKGNCVIMINYCNKKLNKSIKVINLCSRRKYLGLNEALGIEQILKPTFSKQVFYLTTKPLVYADTVS